MPKYQGWLKHTQYFKIEVEADCVGTARDLMWDKTENIDWGRPAEMDNEIVDIEELQNANGL